MPRRAASREVGRGEAAVVVAVERIESGRLVTSKASSLARRTGGLDVANFLCEPLRRAPECPVSALRLAFRGHHTGHHRPLSYEDNGANGKCGDCVSHAKTKQAAHHSAASEDNHVGNTLPSKAAKALRSNAAEKDLVSPC
ncbi:unnamed protein product [Lampetra fluviatilis]